MGSSGTELLSMVKLILKPKKAEEGRVPMIALAVVVMLLLAVVVTSTLKTVETARLLSSNASNPTLFVNPTKTVSPLITETLILYGWQ